MPTVYSAVFSIAGVNAADGVLFNLKSTTTDRAEILEVAFFVETAPTSAPIFGLKRMNAVGTGAITTASPFSFDSAAPAATIVLETAWATTRPTVTGGSALRGQTPTVIGNGVMYNFRGSPILVPISAGVCGVMLNASGATLGVLGGHVVWSE